MFVFLHGVAPDAGKSVAGRKHCSDRAFLTQEAANDGTLSSAPDPR